MNLQIAFCLNTASVSIQTNFKHTKQLEDDDSTFAQQFPDCQKHWGTVTLANGVARSLLTEAKLVPKQGFLERYKVESKGVCGEASKCSISSAILK